jgi:hypothetical protein
MTFSITAFRITTSSLQTIFIISLTAALKIIDIKHNDIQANDTKNNSIQNNDIQLTGNLHNGHNCSALTLSITTYLWLLNNTSLFEFSITLDGATEKAYKFLKPRVDLIKLFQSKFILTFL